MNIQTLSRTIVSTVLAAGLLFVTVERVLAACAEEADYVEDGVFQPCGGDSDCRYYYHYEDADYTLKAYIFCHDVSIEDYECKGTGHWIDPVYWYAWEGSCSINDGYCSFASASIADEGTIENNTEENGTNLDGCAS